LAPPATAAGRVGADASAVAGLARFFPEAMPLRLSMQLARGLDEADLSAAHFTESTIVEFGTSREVLFSCSTPLEFADLLRLRSSDGVFDFEASVVAVQYQPGKTIVAARFRKKVPNWIIKS